MKKLLGRATLLAATITLAIVGCAKKQASLPPPQPPMVDVANPVQRYVTEYEYFTGRTEASEMVEIRARVSGYLTSAPVAKSEAKNGEVKEGDDVEKGRLLFEIDRRTFLAEKERAEANIKQYEALTDTLERNYRTAVRSGSGVSQLDLIKISGDLAQAKANVMMAKASLKTAEVNLDYTRISAPFKGRLSRRYVDPGNLVKADDTILTTLVKLDPIHASFDVDERTVIRFRTLLKAKEIVSARKEPLKVMLALADEEKYTRPGVIDFADNRLDPSTGTLRIRVETRNEDLFLSPGMFIRLRLPVGKERQALLVPEAALASKQGQKIVYVIRTEEARDDKGAVILDANGKPRMVEKAYTIDVDPGQLETDNWRVIKHSGGKGQVLKPTDRVVISGLQRVRDRGEVRVAPKNPDAKQAADQKAKATRS
jgi:RND family efflux transporter MFP subunit